MNHGRGMAAGARRGFAPREGWRWGAAAVVVLGVAVAAAVGWWAQERIAALEAEGAALQIRLQVLRDTLAFVRGPHTRAIAIPVTTGGRLGTVMVFEDTVAHRWLVRCENLAPNEPDQTYQLWFVTDAGLLPARVLPIERDEPLVALLDLPGGEWRVAGVAMSIEPRSGSDTLTGPTVFKEML